MKKVQYFPPAGVDLPNLLELVPWWNGKYFQTAKRVCMNWFELYDSEFQFE